MLEFSNLIVTQILSITVIMCDVLFINKLNMQSLAKHCGISEITHSRPC